MYSSPLTDAWSTSNLAKYRIGVVVVHVPKNQLPYYRAVQQELVAAVRAVRAGEAIHVGARASR